MNDDDAILLKFCELGPKFTQKARGIIITILEKKYFN